MSDVIQIGDFLMKRKRERFIPRGAECRHLRVEIDDHGQIVTCMDCGKQVQPFWALVQLAEEWAKSEGKLESGRRKLREDQDRALHLLAAQIVEKAWRSHTMVPVCPHCRKGILPSDGLGRSMVNKAMELRRREVAGKKQ